MAAAPFEIAFDGALLRGEADGFGLPVVFLHAECADRRMWAGQMEEVAAEGYHVIAYDRRGHGTTDTENMEFDDLVDLEMVLDQLSLHAVILVGCGEGGALALDFAIEHPERTIGLVLSGTGISGEDPPDFPDEAIDLEDALDYARDRGHAESVNRIEAHVYLDGPLSESGRVTGEVRELFLDMNAIVLEQASLPGREERDPAWPSLPSVTAPTLLVVGELDFPDMIARHDDLSEELETSFAVVLEECARMAPLERPELFNPILLEFLDAVSGQGDGDDEDETDGA